MHYYCCGGDWYYGQIGDFVADVVDHVQTIGSLGSGRHETIYHYHFDDLVGMNGTIGFDIVTVDVALV